MSDQLTEAMHGFGMQDFCRRFIRHPAKVLNEIKQVEVGCKNKVSRIEIKHVKSPTQEELSTTDQRSQV